MRISDEAKTVGGRRVSRGNLLLTLPFLLLFLVQLVHHQMWRDELNAFGIAVASPNVRQLLAYVHYEGHPWLWYGLLWVVSRITPNPVGMKVLEGLIGIAIYLVIGMASPFSKIEKLLLFVSYFISFEYSVMSRMYSLMLLIALLYVRNRAARPDGLRFGGSLLGLLASTDVTGLVLSVGFACELVWSGWREAVTTKRTAWLAGAGLYAGLAVWSLAPARDISTRTVGHMFEWARNGGHLLTAFLNYVVVPYFPTMTGRPHSFWNASAAAHPSFFLLMLPVVLALYWVVLRRDRNLMVLLAVTLLGMVSFAHLVYMGSVRNYGVAFVSFVACLWMIRGRGERLSWAAYALLGLSVIGGLDADAEQWMRPFSNAENAAAWLKWHELGEAVWVGSPDTSVAGVAEVLQRRIYMLDCDCSDSFLLFSKRRDGFAIGQIPDRMVVARSLGVDEFVYLGTAAFTPEQVVELAKRGFVVRELARFTGADAVEEDFFVYEVSGGP